MKTITVEIAMTRADRKHLVAAQSRLGVGDWRSAHYELNDIASHDRAEPEVLLARCDVYVLAGQWDRAEPVATRLAARLPQDWRPLYVLAKCKANRGDLFAAVMFLEQAISLCPSDIRQGALHDPHLEPLWRSAEHG